MTKYWTPDSVVDCLNTIVFETLTCEGAKSAEETEELMDALRRYAVKALLLLDAPKKNDVGA